MSQKPLHTPRLTLRIGQPSDAASLVEALGDREVSGQLSRVPWPYTLADADRFIVGMAGGTNEGLPRFLIFQRVGAGETLVGGIGVTRGGGDAIKIGYWVARRAWGQGIASEALAVFFDVLRDQGWKWVFAEHKPDNAASARVLEKCGFEMCGRDLESLKSQPGLVLRQKSL